MARKNSETKVITQLGSRCSELLPACLPEQIFGGSVDKYFAPDSPFQVQNLYISDNMY